MLSERENPAPGLIWTDVFAERCPLTGGPITDRDVALEIVGFGLPSVNLVFGWSPKAQCHLATLDELMGIAEIVGLPPHAATSFRIDGREVDAALCFTGQRAVIPWPEIVAKMQKQEDEPVDPAEIRRLPRLDETWEVATREGEPVDVGGKLRPSQMVVVLNAEGKARAATLGTGALQPSHIIDAVYDATVAQPEIGCLEGRPARVVFSDSGLAGRLRRLLKKAGIALTVAPTPRADAAVEDLARHTARIGRIDKPLLGDIADDDLHAFLEAARSFYAAAPWTRLRGDRYVAFRLDDGPWLYANVMGQQNEEHGLALFDSWLGLCRFVSAVPAPGMPALEALNDTGAAEGMTLFPLSVFHEADAERLAAVGGPVLDGMYPLASRFTATGGIEPSAWPTDLYAALMRALPEVIAKRRADTITSIKAVVETPQGTLTMRYPADGTEALTGREPAVELAVEPAGRDDGFLPMTPLDTATLRVTGPAATRLPQADHAIKSALPWGHIRILEMDGRPVWFGDTYADDPAPTLDDLAGAQSLRVYFGSEWHPASARRLSEPIREITADLV